VKLKKKIAPLFASLLCAINWAQELSPIQDYSPIAYQAENQNWAVSHSADYIIYISNNKGPLDYNGLKWAFNPSPNETISFAIIRPWYQTKLLLAIYLLGAVLLIFLVHQAYKRHYQSRQQQMMENNQRELELIRIQNEKDIVKLKNDQLKKDFKNKSNELAAATMSIIKKNELLTRVKKQLLDATGNNETTKQIITLIDRNLNQNDDWELFKDAFNNADRKFLKKLNKAHPNLSPNEIRLCSYLRLNLSSKEIAGLFNISPRSIEIKRYRLRKKLNLNHEENLVNYMLKL